MPEISDKTVEGLAKYLFYSTMDLVRYDGDITWGNVSSAVHSYWVGRAKRLLSLNPELAMVDRKATLPAVNFDELKEAGWVKEVKE